MRPSTCHLANYRSGGVTAVVGRSCTRSKFSLFVNSARAVDSRPRQTGDLKFPREKASKISERARISESRAATVRFREERLDRESRPRACRHAWRRLCHLRPTIAARCEAAESDSLLFVLPLSTGRRRRGSAGACTTVAGPQCFSTFKTRARQAVHSCAEGRVAGRVRHDSRRRRPRSAGAAFARARY